MPRRRTFATMATAALLAFAPAALAYPAPPKLPNSTRGAKYCGKASRYGYSYRFYITRGKQRVTCKRAKRLLKETNPASGRNPRHWVYYDWTKGGNGPWSDVWMRRDRKVVVAAIIKI